MSVKANGQPRKLLCALLDRLDGIIDSLSDGLNQAVSTAVEAAVGQAVERAVQGVLTELIHNPAVRAMLRAVPAAPPEPDRPPTPTSPSPSLLRRVGEKLRSVGRSCAAGLNRSWKLVLAAGAGGAAGAAFLGRSRLGRAAATICGWAVGLAGAAGGFLCRTLPNLV
jgi:hypothetical protein